MSGAGEVFWRDLARDLQDPEFLREYVVDSMRIATIDAIVNELDGARQAAGLTKAALARSVGQDPAAIRRLFTSRHVSPTLGTVVEVAAVLGMRITLEPLDEPERQNITESLLQGRAADPTNLARHLTALRRTREPANS